MTFLDADLAREDFGYLETAGRRSGRPHVIEIWFAADPDNPRVYMLAGGRDRTDWVLNIRADPRVKMRIAGRTFGGSARELEGTPEEELARKLVGAKYGYWREGTELRGWARDSLPVAIDLSEPDELVER
jgi:deazaflavin-dependent oxidoreductase (nitroreductase family)